MISHQLWKSVPSTRACRAPPCYSVVIIVLELLSNTQFGKYELQMQQWQLPTCWLGSGFRPWTAPSMPACFQKQGSLLTLIICVGANWLLQDKQGNAEAQQHLWTVFPTPPWSQGLLSTVCCFRRLHGCETATPVLPAIQWQCSKSQLRQWLEA